MRAAATAVLRIGPYSNVVVQGAGVAWIAAVICDVQPRKTASRESLKDRVLVILSQMGSRL